MSDTPVSVRTPPNRENISETKQHKQVSEFGSESDSVLLISVGW